MTNPVNKTQEARIFIFTDDGTDGAVRRIDDLVSDAPITPGAPITVDATTFADAVQRLVTVGESPATIAMQLVVGADSSAIERLLAVRGQVGKKSLLYIQLPNWGTVDAPTLPTLVDGVPGWTLPAGPFTGSDFSCDIEVQTSTPVIVKNEIDREAVAITVQSRILRGLAGETVRA